MVCEPDETDLDIHIPAVMLPQDAGTRLEKMLMSTSSGEVLFHFHLFGLFIFIIFADFFYPLLLVFPLLPHQGECETF